ncbi:hypothetical protein HELRODRAFT_95830 [Helobdella robusta]|uniref:Metalloendopeptidase OMA1, mitochondrial n=1 Tax=Helobdella robusta TaxID=6412 RepID=T1G979_HELRO|nr:hypothetical protein HELRODRAFT_95830 [Helobdella robusta]ESN94678.1 hypothetical protein HELRODRAFT_95830 [Helobdella robusta]
MFALKLMTALKPKFSNIAVAMLGREPSMFLSKPKNCFAVSNLSTTGQRPSNRIFYNYNCTTINYAVKNKTTTNNINNTNIISRSARLFHTTPRRYINPIILMLVKPLSKFVSMFSGRYFRIWWRRLTPEQKLHYKNKFFKNYKYLVIPFGVLVIGEGIFYYTHLQTTPITNRKRFIGISDDQMMKLSEFELKVQIEQLKENIVPANHPLYRKIQLIVQRLIDSNGDLDKLRTQHWTICVVNNDTSNAFVLPSGHIFVFTGLMKHISNDDELAFILGHEIAHAVLNHGAEQVSFSSLLDVLIIISMAMIWAIMPGDGLAMVTQWFYDKVLNIMLHLPYSRKLELEADEVGLRLVAKACFDVREASLIWQKWSLLEQLNGDGNANDLPALLSTHPNFEERSDKLDNLMQDAIDMRKLCNCPELKSSSSSNDLKRLKMLVDEKLSKNDRV